MIGLLTRHQIDELRLAADRAQLECRIDEASLMGELLDAAEAGRRFASEETALTTRIERLESDLEDARCALGMGAESIEDAVTVLEDEDIGRRTAIDELRCVQRRLRLAKAETVSLPPEKKR